MRSTSMFLLSRPFLLLVLTFAAVPACSGSSPDGRRPLLGDSTFQGGAIGAQGGSIGKTGGVPGTATGGCEVSMLRESRKRGSGGSGQAGAGGSGGTPALGSGGSNVASGGSNTGVGGTNTGTGGSVNNGAMTTVTYQSDTTDFPNPERGFYHQYEIFPGDTLSQSAISQARANNITMVRVYFRIDAFTNAALSTAALNSFTNSLAAVRAAGAKIIPRFSYNFGAAPDAPLSRIQSHLAQLKPILQSNSDVIAFVEAGFSGWWGEWHDSTNNLDNAQSRGAIADAWMDALPASRMVALRYNRDKRELYGNAPLTSQEAFQNTPKARIGSHNDCLGASPEDWGTYTYGGDIEGEKNFLNQDNRFVPQGGETCNPTPLCDAPKVMEDLERMRWDTINLDYEPTCISQWRTEGSFATIAKSLGYRLRLLSSKLSTQVVPGGAISGFLEVVNDGWGKVYNQHNVVLVLRPSAGADIHIPLTSVDPRFWLKGATITVPFSETIPANTPAGSYTVFLGLLDPASALSTRAEYSIRLANQNMWKSDGLNDLRQMVTVRP